MYIRANQNRRYQAFHHIGYVPLFFHQIVQSHWIPNSRELIFYSLLDESQVSFSHSTRTNICPISIRHQWFWNVNIIPHWTTLKRFQNFQKHFRKTLWTLIWKILNKCRKLWKLPAAPMDGVYVSISHSLRPHAKQTKHFSTQFVIWYNVLCTYTYFMLVF